MPDLCDCFIFKPLWWKDYGIPLLEAVAVPLLVWFLTWYYGAEKAEERKEKRELRDNLNLLLSVCLSNIIKVLQHRSELIKIYRIETTKKKIDIDFALQEISKVYCVKNDFNYIDISKYSSCIALSENYMRDLIIAKNAMELQIAKINHRNESLEKIFNCENVTTRNRLMMDFIELDARAFNVDIKYTENTLLSLNNLIKETKELENKIEGLKLDTIKYSEEQEQLLAELEQKYKKGQTE